MTQAQRHHLLTGLDHSCEAEIEVPDTEIPFKELILSWNGFRPTSGYWLFSIRLYQSTGHSSCQPAWSDWLPLAEWGANSQRTFSYNPPESLAYSYQDVAVVKEGHCTGYKIHLEAKEGASLASLHSITVSFGDPSQLSLKPFYDLSSIALTNIPAQSQQRLAHPRCKDFCSPTSTTAAINFLLGDKKINPVHFAQAARDQTFDIYGNWILNTAAAFEALQGKYRTYVTRLLDFREIHAQLLKGVPVVVSVKGPLPGAPLPYAFGHLILIIGYDQINRRVLCMDPAHEIDAATLTSYPLDAFLVAWTERRKNLAYLFEKIADLKDS